MNSFRKSTTLCDCPRCVCESLNELDVMTDRQPLILVSRPQGAEGSSLRPGGGDPGPAGSPALPTPSPPGSQFPICKVQTADPKLASVQKYKQGPRRRVSVGQHGLIWHHSWGRLPAADFLQRRWSRQGTGLDHGSGVGAVSIPGCPFPTPREGPCPLASRAAATRVSVTVVAPVFPLSCPAVPGRPVFALPWPPPSHSCRSNTAG